MPEDRMVAGRYRLEHEIGRGGFGRVWRAVDRVTDRPVAVKLLPLLAPSDAERLSLECAALRLTRVPGIVPLLDDGVEDDMGFLVMPLVDGRPFPGLDGAVSWERLRPLAIGLLETLARVHARGLVHRDLKPGNVLVDVRGQVHLLDFGVAGGGALDRYREQWSFEGSPFHAAPEHRRGLPVDARADLWSVGAMLYEALTGGAMWPEATVEDLFFQARDPVVPPLQDSVPDLPARVRDLVERLLAFRASDRPEDALTALRALSDGELGRWRGIGHLPARSSIVDLRALFRGPDRFKHLQTDGADALFDRTGGRADRVHAEVEAWLRTGVCHLLDDRLVVDRAGLGSLREGVRLRTDAPSSPDVLGEDADLVSTVIRHAWPHAQPARLAGALAWSTERLEAALAALQEADVVWLSADGSTLCTDVVALPIPVDPRTRLAVRALVPFGSIDMGLAPAGTDLTAGDEVPVMLFTAEQHLMAGRSDQAASVSAYLLRRARAVREVESEVAAAALLTETALGAGGEDLVDQALREVALTAVMVPEVRAFEQLLRARVLVSQGQWDRADALLSDLGDLPRHRMQAALLGLRFRVQMARGPDVGERFVTDLAATTRTVPELEGLRLGWLGLVRYGQRRYEEAATCHRQSQLLKREMSARLSSTMNGAAALLEAHAHEEALAMAEAARQQAEALRLVLFETMATWLVRSARFRMGEAVAPDPDLVDAAASVGAYQGALFGMLEAAILRRQGQGGHVGLAEAAWRAGVASGYGHLTWLAAAMLVEAEAPGAPSPSSFLPDCLDKAPPGIALQVAALAGGDRAGVDRDRALALAHQLTPDSWRHRREVLSVDEALAVWRRGSA